MDLQEEKLIAAFRKGDQQAFETLFKGHYAALCRYGFSFLNDRDAAEDVVQNVFVSMWEKRTDYEIQASFKGYLYRMVRNACLNVLKHEKVVALYAEGNVQSEATHVDQALELATANELGSMIEKAMDKLPEQCRAVFELSRYENLKYSEIAQRLGISEKTVENQIGKALRIMREQLKEYLVLAFIFLFLK